MRVGAGQLLKDAVSALVSAPRRCGYLFGNVRTTRRRSRRRRWSCRGNALATRHRTVLVTGLAVKPWLR